MSDFKVTIVGDNGAGKSTLLYRIGNDSFNPQMTSTVQIEFFTKKITCMRGGANQEVSLKLWDTAGQEKFGSLTKSYLRDSYCIIVAFDVTNVQSFNAVQGHIQEMQNMQPNTFFVIVGTKCDLPQQQWVVEKPAIDELCRQYSCKYFQVSSLNGDGINELVEFIAQNGKKPETANVLKKSDEKQGCC